MLSLNIGRINVKSYDICISGRRSIERTIEIMDVDDKDIAINRAEAELAKAMGCELAELTDIEVERCIYNDPNEDADYKNMEQKTLRNIQGT